MLLIGLFYIFFPTLLIALLLLKRQPNILMWALTLLASGLSISFIWTIARWEMVSIYLRPAFPILYLIACVVSYKRIKKTETPQSKMASILGIGMNVLIIVFMSVMNWLAFRGYRVPENTIDLTSPLRDGRYIVLHGGSRPMVNAHFHVNPQNYALDIVGLNSLGMRSPSIGGGPNLDDYVIYGESVYSPCNGRVILAVDEFDDLTPPHTDTKNLAGNHILIESEGKEILLAHLKKGSITVQAGDSVSTNMVLGQVGNTGNTTEPHLHIHVEYGGEPNTILNGKAVPFTINDRFLVRGDIITSQ